jgi:hypothetical protein
MRPKKAFYGIKCTCIYCLLTLLFVTAGYQLHAQCPNAISIPITMNCVKLNEVCDGYDFLNTNNSSCGWSPSNGTPEIVPYAGGKGGTGTYYYLQMEANGDGGEGVFAPSNFINGQTYSLSIGFGSTGQGSVTILASNGLVQQQNACQGGLPSVSNKQVIGSFTNSTTSPYTSAQFTIGGGNANLGGNYTGYTQFWMYSAYSTGSINYTPQVTSVTICPVCSPAGPTSGMGVTNGGTTLTWPAVTGAASYNIFVIDTHNGSPTYSTLTSNWAGVNFCALGVGDNVSFTVQPVCPNGGTGTTGSPYSYTYSPTALGTTSQITFTAPYTVTWAPVPNATSYYYYLYLSGNAPIGVNGTSVSDPDAMLDYGQTYNVEIEAINACVSGSWSAPTEIVVPPACSPSPTVANVEGGTYVTLYAVSGAVSYNVGFENSAGTIVKQFDDIGSVITSSGYQCTGVPPGSYNIVAQTNCSNGGTSPWGSPYFGGMQTIPSTCSPAPTFANVEGGTYINLYPVSGASSYNIAYENAEGVIVWQMDNIGPVITTSGYNCTGVPGGSFYILASTNCTSGETSSWNTYSGGLQYINNVITPLESRTSSISITGTPGDSTIALSVYPNPSRSQANIIYNTPVTGPANLTVITEFGNTVIRKAISTVVGQNNYALDIGQLANGIYFIRLTDGKNIRYQKLIIAK